MNAPRVAIIAVTAAGTLAAVSLLYLVCTLGPFIIQLIEDNDFSTVGMDTRFSPLALAIYCTPLVVLILGYVIDWHIWKHFLSIASFVAVALHLILPIIFILWLKQQISLQS